MPPRLLPHLTKANLWKATVCIEALSGNLLKATTVEKATMSKYMQIKGINFLVSFMNSFDVFSKMSTIDSELFSTCHKDHKCKYCGKSFTTASHLKNHKDIVYEGHNDYNCESCGKSFSEA